MTGFTIEYMLLFLVVGFIFYYLINDCDCKESFSISALPINITENLILNDCSPPEPMPDPPKTEFICERKSLFTCLIKTDLRRTPCKFNTPDKDEIHPDFAKSSCIPSEKYNINASCIYHDSCKSGACKKKEGEKIGICVTGIDCKGDYEECEDCMKKYKISQYPKGNGIRCPSLVINCDDGKEGCKFKECTKNDVTNCKSGEICMVNKCLNCSNIPIDTPYSDEKFLKSASYLCKEYKEYCNIYDRGEKGGPIRPNENKYICRTKKCPIHMRSNPHINSCSDIIDETTCNESGVSAPQGHKLYEICKYNDDKCTNTNSDGNIDYCKTYR
jgi:hypothetical protein